MLGQITIHEPRSVAEASHFLATLGSEAAIYAGGTELLVLLKERVVEIPHLVNIKSIPGLDLIRREDNAIVIGALATHRAIERNPLIRLHLPLFADLEANVANVRVRSAGTIGGNLCFAEPHSDPATLLVAWDATFTLATARGFRQISAEEFFTGLLQTARQDDEVLTEIRIPLPQANTRSAYERFKIHERPTATVAVVLRVADDVIDEARLVIGSVGDRPARIRSAEAILLGQRPTDERFDTAALAAHDEIEPVDDPFESNAYKRHLVRVLTNRALRRARNQGGVRSA